VYQTRENHVRFLTHARFRWVSLQIQNLSDFTRFKHEEAVRKALGRLPKTLYDLYIIIYEQIQYSHDISTSVAETAMKWLLCAQRPLKSQELIATLSVRADNTVISLTHDHLLDICCNLVVLDTELDVFRFAHLSVREFLESRGGRVIYEAHQLATARCVDTVLFNADSQQSSIPKETWSSILEHNRVFTSYAVPYWPFHYDIVEKSEGGDGSLKSKVSPLLFDDSDNFQVFAKWVESLIEARNEMKWRGPPYLLLDVVHSLPPTPFFLACFFGWSSVLEELSELKSFNCNLPNSGQITGLEIAAEQGHEALIQILQAKGVDIMIKTRAGLAGVSAMHLAVSKGYEAVVKLLLHMGLDLNLKDRNQTALHLAVLRANESMVTLLLDSGADTEAADSMGRTPLVVANEGRGETFENIIKVLVSMGANPKARDRGGTPSLHRAAERSEATVKLLLDAGADTRAKDQYGNVALHQAATYGRVAVVKLLLERGSEIDSKNKYGYTVLHKAAGEGYVAVVELLLENGAEFRVKDADGLTALDMVKKERDRAVMMEDDGLEERCQEVIWLLECANLPP
jgi:ankyrin repeat protein